VHVTRLIDAGSATPRWAEYDGTHVVTPLFNGRANIGVLEIAGPMGRIEGLQLRLYDPATHQWKLSFANGSDGKVQPPSIGRFDGDRGTFFESTRIAGRDVPVRTITTRLTASTYRDVTAYSADGGRMWNPLWIASYEKLADAGPASTAPGGLSSTEDHGFDFQIGSWHVNLKRLLEPLSHAHLWRNYHGSLVVRRLWNGRANVGELHVSSGKDRIEYIMLRTYDPQTERWSDYSTDMDRGSVSFPPTVGSFRNHHGELYDRQTFAGRPVSVRYVFDQITVRSCRFVQSFSTDNGKTWEPNLVVLFKRVIS
jgi:hypothetical protein